MKIKKILPVLLVFSATVFAFQNCNEVELQSLEAQNLPVNEEKGKIMPPLDSEVKSFKVVLDEYPMVPRLNFNQSYNSVEANYYKVPTKILITEVEDKKADLIEVIQREDLHVPGGVFECTTSAIIKKDHARKILEMVRDARIRKFKGKTHTSIVDAAIYSISINGGPKVRLGELNLKEDQHYTEDIEPKRISAFVSSISKSNSEKLSKVCHTIKDQKISKKSLKSFRIYTVSNANHAQAPFRNYNVSYYVSGDGKNIQVRRKLNRKPKSKGCVVRYRIENILAKKLQNIILDLKIKRASGRSHQSPVRMFNMFSATRILSNGQKTKLPLGEVYLKKGQRYFDEQVLVYIRERISDKKTKVLSNTCPVH